MIPCRPTGTAAFCYGLTAADNLSYSCNQRGIVSVQCTQSTTMVDDNGIPIPIHQPEYVTLPASAATIAVP